MLVAPWGVASCQDILRMLAENGIPPSSLIWRFFLGGACELVTSLDVLFGKLEMDFFFVASRFGDVGIIWMVCRLRSRIIHLL